MQRAVVVAQLVEVALSTRGPWFESSHRQTLYDPITSSVYEKTKRKEKEAGIGPFLKKISFSAIGIVQNLLFRCPLTALLIFASNRRQATNSPIRKDRENEISESSF